MGLRHIRDEVIELQIVLNQECNWWVLIKTAYLTIDIKGELANIKLPIPEIFGNPKWHDERIWKKHDDAELARCKAIWNGLIVAMQDKLQRIEAGESTVEVEFKDGILFEDGKYGLKYKESWPL